MEIYIAQTIDCNGRLIPRGMGRTFEEAIHAAQRIAPEPDFRFVVYGPVQIDAALLDALADAVMQRITEALRSDGETAKTSDRRRETSDDAAAGV